MSRYIIALAAALFLFSSSLMQDSAQAQRGAPTVLPEGPGKALVETVCSTCHSTATIARAAGYSTAADWRRVFSTMIELNDSQATTVASYLAQHFPEDTSRRPTLIAGDVEIEIIEWTVPTLGQRVRDPAEAPDGSIWMTELLGSRWKKLPFVSLSE